MIFKPEVNLKCTDHPDSDANDDHKQETLKGEVSLHC